MNACYHAHYGQCTCQPGDPPIGHPDYAAKRRHVDAGDLDALRQVTAWLQAGEPQCHIRFADGEFMSILGAPGANCDGQDHLSDTLGAELGDTLEAIARRDADANVLVGGDWRRPAHTWDWLGGRGLDKAIPWCPSQVFVNGIVSGDSPDFLGAVRAHPGRKHIVANPRVCAAVELGLGATPRPVPIHNAYDAMARVEDELRAVLRPGDVVLYAAGLGCKPTVWRLFTECPGTSHIDVGCFFDLAAGIRSRSWCKRDDDGRVVEYRRSIIPWLGAA